MYEFTVCIFGAYFTICLYLHVFFLYRFMSLSDVILVHILQYVRGDILYRRRCVHSTTRGRICKKRPMKGSILCVHHEKIFQECWKMDRFESLLLLNECLLGKY